MSTPTLSQPLAELESAVQTITSLVTTLRRGRNTICLVNRSTTDAQGHELLPDAAADALTADLQQQVSRDFAPIWGVDATLVYVPKTRTAPPTAWWLVFLDDSDSANALGYHQLTDTGLPLGKVFVRTDAADGMPVSTTASHELLELLADPWASLLTLQQTGATTGQLVPFECCDPVEDPSLGYTVGSSLVSDFVTPAWFQEGATGVRFDFCGHLTAPLTLAQGGYRTILPVTLTSDWQEEDAQGKTTPLGGTDDARYLPKSAWRRSTGR